MLSDRFYRSIPHLGIDQHDAWGHGAFDYCGHYLLFQGLNDRKASEKRHVCDTCREYLVVLFGIDESRADAECEGLAGIAVFTDFHDFVCSSTRP